MTWALFLAAFSMGLFGSPHCLGMCGGIVTAFGLSMQHVSDSKKNEHDDVKLSVQHRKIGASQNNAYLKHFIWNSLS